MTNGPEAYEAPSFYSAPSIGWETIEAVPAPAIEAILRLPFVQLDTIATATDANPDSLAYVLTSLRHIAKYVAGGCPGEYAIVDVPLDSWNHPTVALIKQALYRLFDVREDGLIRDDLNDQSAPQDLPGIVMHKGSLDTATPVYLVRRQSPDNPDTHRQLVILNGHPRNAAAITTAANALSPSETASAAEVLTSFGLLQPEIRQLIRADLVNRWNTPTTTELWALAHDFKANWQFADPEYPETNAYFERKNTYPL